jgi:uncharacterized Tic20 family protein
MNVTDELQKLQQLHHSGALSEEEFSQAKATLLSRRDGTAQDPAALDRETNQWGMILHLSLLAGFVVPLAGLIVPIVLWQVKKTQLPGIDVHGKIVVNWIITAIIYSVVSVILIFAIIGIPLLIALGIVGIVFPIIGAIKASEGVAWKYPLSLSLIK